MVYRPPPLPLGILVGRMRDGNTTAVVLEDIWFQSRQFGLKWRIPAGYITDFASVPAAARPLFTSFGEHSWAAVAHDWLYSVGEPKTPTQDCRGRADDIFLEKMEEAKVSWVRRSAMFRAVRLGGGTGYEKAEGWWGEAFADPETGEPRSPPFSRESCFFGGANGPEAWTPEHMT